MTHWPDLFRAAVAFDAAVERYRAKFGEAALPVLPGIGGAGGPGGEAVEWRWGCCATPWRTASRCTAGLS